jgi:hypothetical protein
MPALDQLVHQIRANETGRARDAAIHNSSRGRQVRAQSITITEPSAEKKLSVVLAKQATISLALARLKSNGRFAPALDLDMPLGNNSFQLYAAKQQCPKKDDSPGDAGTGCEDRVH